MSRRSSHPSGARPHRRSSRRARSSRARGPAARRSRSRPTFPSTLKRRAGLSTSRTRTPASRCVSMREQPAPIPRPADRHMNVERQPVRAVEVRRAVVVLHAATRHARRAIGPTRACRATCSRCSRPSASPACRGGRAGSPAARDRSSGRRWSAAGIRRCCRGRGTPAGRRSPG